MLDRWNDLYLFLSKCGAPARETLVLIVFCARHYATKSHMKAVAKRVFDILVKSDKVVIFSKSGCPQSQTAKSIFDDIKQKYTAIELDRREDGALLQTHLAMVTGSPLMPRIYIIGKCIGGTCELCELYRNGGLLRMLNQDV
ncbi:hypothetical protein RUM43_009405 [Polyplax serrata]|uniref:Glutaredoxin domain-containing protein n=1 Tax=Polyplax serrata TaxID=468196 RepID=A0AAN8S252_POLSC